MACPWKPPKKRQWEGGRQREDLDLVSPPGSDMRWWLWGPGAPSSPSCLLKPPNTWRREAGTTLMTPRFRSPACILWWTLYSLSQYYGNTCTQFVTRTYQLYKSFFECIKFKVPVNHPQTISLNKTVLLILTDHLFSILLHTESASCSVVSHSLWPLDCSPPGSSGHGMVQARILEWIAIPFARGSSQSRDWTQVTCIAGRFFTIWATYYTLSDLKLSSRWEHADRSGERMLLQGPYSLPLPARSGDLLKGKKPNSDIHHPAIGQGL